MQNERETIVSFYKRPLFRIFWMQFGVIAFYSIILITVYFSFYIPFLVTLLFTPLVLTFILLHLIYLLKAKHTKSIIGIDIDFQSQTIKIEQFNFFGKNKIKMVDFEDFNIEEKGIWMSNYYGFAAILKEKNKTFAIIPIIGSIWNKAEIKSITQEFEKVKAIKKEIVNALDMKIQDQKTEY